MMRLIGLSAAALTAIAALSACAPTTTTLAEFNARQLDRVSTSVGLAETTRQKAGDGPYTRGATDAADQYRRPN